MVKCKKCGAEIEFRLVYSREYGYKKHPFNAGTNTSHFKTCPYAKDFLPDKPKLPFNITPNFKGGLDYFIESESYE